MGKTTLVTIIGERPTLVLYGAIGILSVLIAITAIFLLTPHPSPLTDCPPETGWTRSEATEGVDNPLTAHLSPLFPLLFLPLHLRINHLLRTINHGKELNRVLGMTAMSIFFFAILVSLALVL